MFISKKKKKNTTNGEKKMPNKYKIHNRIICDVSLYDCNRMFVVLQLTVEKIKYQIIEQNDRNTIMHANAPHKYNV